MQMLAIGGIEILIGATALLSLLAVVAFFMGDKKERAAAETPRAADEPVVETQAVPKAKLAGVKVEGKPKSVLPDLPQLDGSKEKDTKPALPQTAAKDDEAEPTAEGDLERKFIEKRLQRMADKRAEEKQDEPKELPVFPKGPSESKPAADLPKPFVRDLAPAEEPASPKDENEEPALSELPKPKDKELVPELPAKPESIKEKPDLPSLPKPDLPEIPKPTAEKPDLPPLPAEAKVEAEAEAASPPLPKRGGDLPPLPDSPSVEDEADLQTREQEREV